jgi:hypothetical protein
MCVYVCVCACVRAGGRMGDGGGGGGGGGCHSDWALLQRALGGLYARTVRYRRLFVAARRLINWHNHMLQQITFDTLRYLLNAATLYPLPY